MRRRLCAALLCCLPLLAQGTIPARAAPGDGPPDAGRARPVPGEVERGWAPPPVRWAAGHRGVDLAARPGEPVHAVAAGRVRYAGRVAGRGVVSIELAATGDPPLRTTYEPVSARVRRGDRVAAGDVVGVLEADGSHCPAGCLHWGLRRGDTYLDPFLLLRPGTSRLLPVLGAPSPGGTETPGGPKDDPGGTFRQTAAGRSSPTDPVAAGAALALLVATAWAHRRHTRPRTGSHRRDHPRPSRKEVRDGDPLVPFSRRRRAAPSTPRPG
ncbi:MAG TPA: M23 family metallopeptidase [Streptomyces sp.]|nr:M23 family metallopeptidase [Streptomyces sp.]